LTPTTYTKNTNQCSKNAKSAQYVKYKNTKNIYIPDCRSTGGGMTSYYKPFLQINRYQVGGTNVMSYGNVINAAL